MQVTSVINTAPAFFLYLLSDWRTFLLSMCPYILLSFLFMFLLSPFMLHCSNYTHSNPINPKHLWTFTLMTSHWHSLMRVTCSHSSCFHTSADQRDPPPPPCIACSQHALHWGKENRKWCWIIQTSSSGSRSQSSFSAWGRSTDKWEALAQDLISYLTWIKLNLNWIFLRLKFFHKIRSD